MSKRSTVLHRIAEVAGREVLDVEDLRGGWPGIVRVRVDGGAVVTAMHVGPIGLSHRGRDEVERRFQNPGQGRPVEAPQGMVPLLIGLWEEGQRPVLVGMEATRRLGRGTRQSLFIPLWLLEQADRTGWAEHYSSSNERIVGLHPALLPIYVEMIRQGAKVSPQLLTSVIEASGMNDELPESPAERVRRSAQVLVRDARFRERVIGAYDGLCAMCGLDLGLLEAAHIYPASAPGSFDEIWNGLALCRNHHAVLDRHLVWVDPASRRITLHPEIRGSAPTSSCSAHFVESTYEVLAEPGSPLDRPRPEMITRRYEHFEGLYDWARG